MNRDRERLFEEFPPVSTEEWEDQIRRDLKSADYGETLLWHTRDGMTIRPYYRSNDLNHLAHVGNSETSVAPGTGWVLQQNLTVGGGPRVENEVQAAIEGGAQCIGLEFAELVDDADVSQLLGAIPLDRVGIHLSAGLQTPLLFQRLLEHAEQCSIHTASLSGTLGYDPLDRLARAGEMTFSTLDEAARLVSETDPTEVRLLRAGVEAYHDAGATPVQEAALTIATVSEYFASLIQRGADGHDVARRLYVSVPVSTSFFLEVAKLRALRLLIPQVIHAYLPDESAMQVPIHAVTSMRTMTLYDPHTNLLRATTAAASAVIGGSDVLVIRPFDAVSSGGTAFSHRLARNIHHLMRHEANLDKAIDAAGGSYYLENLTDGVARRAWALFKEIEAQGGLVEALDGEFVQTRVGEARRALEADVAEQRRVLVGTSRYPDADERRRGAAAAGPAESQSAQSKPLSTGRAEKPDVAVEPLEPFREAQVYEEIRLETERLGLQPSILVLPVGAPGVRSARANFAAEFLASGGFAAVVPLGYDTLDEALGAAPKNPDLVVLAAPDAMYSPEVISSVKEALSPSLTGVIATHGVSLEVDFVINSRCDAVATLRKIQNRLRTLSGREEAPLS